MLRLAGLRKEDLLTKCYSLPLAHFNIWKFQNSKETKGYHVQTEKQKVESWQRGEEAHQRVLAALQHLGEAGPDSLRPMFIFSSVNFENVLKDQPENRPTNKKRRRRPSRTSAAACSEDKSKDQSKGEADILIVSRAYGLIMIEIKAVGDLQGTKQGRVADITTSLCKFLKKVQSKRDEAKKLLAKLNLNCPVTLVLALPNVSRQDMKNISETCVQLEEKLASDMPDSRRTCAIRTRCLCEDELPPRHKSTDLGQHRLKELQAWWQGFADSLSLVPDQGMDDSQYESSIADFIGSKSRITIWSPNDAWNRGVLRQDVRSPDEALHETGKRFAMYVLRPLQVSVLDSPEKHLYLTGIPGSGKTMLMVLKAVKWIVEEERDIIIVCIDIAQTVKTPVGLETKKKILETLDLYDQQAKANVVLISDSNTDDPKQVIDRIVKKVRKKNMDPDNVCFLMDEIIDDKARSIIKQLKQKFERSKIWCAGPWPEDKPSGFKSIELLECLRCPPSIQSILSKTQNDCGERCHLYNYSVSSCLETTLSLPSDGPQIKWISHEDHDGSIFECSDCGRRLGRYLVQDLQVGTGSGSLKPCDVLIVTGQISLEHAAFLNAVRAEGLDVQVVEPGSDSRVPDLSLFRSGKVAVATDVALAAGLERMVVVFVPDEVKWNEGECDPTASSHHDSSRRRAARGGSDSQAAALIQPSQILARLGKDSRKVLWHIVSRSLAHAVIMHFGAADVREDGDEQGDADDEEQDKDNEGGNESDENDDDTSDSDDRARKACCVFIVMLIILVGYILYIVEMKAEVEMYNKGRSERKPPTDL